MWRFLVGFLVLGYLLLGRSFAYLGIPSAGLFVGEVSLALFALTRPREFFGRWLGAMVNSTPLAVFGWSLLLLVSYHLVALARGVAAGYQPARALQTFVFCVYPLFVFAGVSVGHRYPGFLDRLLRALAWTGGVYGAAYVLWLNRLDWRMPMAPEVQLLGIGGAASVALVGILASPAPLYRSAVPLVLNTTALLGMLVRARWLGVAAALATLGALRGRAVRALSIAAAGGALLGAAFLLDLEVPAPEGRGGTFSIREVAARLVAVFDAEDAAAFGTESQGSARTVSWRLDMWRAVWDDVHRSVETAALGWGHGAPLDLVVPFVRSDLRSPHGTLVFALGYTGWIGLALFVLVQLSLLDLVWRAYRATGNAFGIGCWVLHLVVAQFGNVLETPFNAVPFYLLTGLAAAPAAFRAGAPHAPAARP